MADCIFCAIRDGEIPAEIVYENENTLCFLDSRPLFKGHLLVVPRTHVPDLFALPDEDVAPYFLVVKRMADVVKERTGAEGVFVASNNRVSQSVLHLHTHVVPRSKGDGLKGFFWPRTKYESGEEMQAVAERMRTALP